MKPEACRKKYPMMTKSAFMLRLVKKRPNLLPNDVQETAQKIFDYMCDILRQGRRIELRGFGSFCLRHRAPRIARNPRTGESLQLPARSVPYFRPGKKLRTRVNGDSRLQVVNAAVSSTVIAPSLVSRSQLPAHGPFSKDHGAGGGDSGI